MNDEEWIDKVFFGEIVDCYMLADLAKIEANYDTAKNCGNCNFPLALQIFSCMDFIGWLISNPKNKPDDTTNNIETFIDTLFSEPRKTQIKEVNKFTKIFRHGLAHEYFAKNAGVSRKGIELLSIDLDKEALILDADVLLAEFRDSITYLKTRFTSQPELGKEMRLRYEEMQNVNSLVADGLIIKSQSQGTTTISVSTILPVFSSNATVPPPSVTLPPKSWIK